MFDYDQIIRQALIDPDQQWRALDSFWRNRTDLDTHDLLHFQAWASTVLELNIHARSNHFVQSQTVPEIQPYLRQPWYPIVLFQDRVVNQSLVLYGGGFDYASPEEIVYGEEGDPRYLYPVNRPIYSVGSISDGLTSPTIVIDPSQFSYDRVQQRLVFDIDPFSLIPVKTDQESGRQYIVLWLRNAEFDLDVPFDQAGWVAKFDRSGDNYAQALKSIWELVLLGPSLDRFEQGLMRAAGLPFALASETVRRVENDGYQNLISTDSRVYVAPLSGLSPTVAPGDELQEGQPLTDGIQFLEYEQVLTASDTLLPGLSLRIPLSTGRVASLTFANIDTDWTFEASRPSEWRFPIGGDDQDIEQFWTDVQTYATDNGLDLATVYGLPAAVNPMQRVVQDLLQNSLYVATMNLADLPDTMGGFADRARLLLPKDVLLVLQQFAGSVSDTYDLGAETSDTVDYGYHVVVPTETISVSGTDLTFFDYAPLVVTS